MEFTYKGYLELIGLLRNRGYVISNYHEWNKHSRCVIIRHDVDYNLERSLRLAEVENDNEIKSTYFILISSDFYNVYSLRSSKVIRKIISLGHEIGLHFDETRYESLMTDEDIVDKIILETEILSGLIGEEVSTVSMHRPSPRMLEHSIDIPGKINSYGELFFKDFKYLSDSRRRWRESPEQIISSGKYDRLHILTHAFWYDDNEKSLYDNVRDFVEQARFDRYRILSGEITDIESILKKEDI